MEAYVRPLHPFKASVQIVSMAPTKNMRTLLILAPSPPPEMWCSDGSFPAHVAWGGWCKSGNSSSKNGHQRLRLECWASVTQHCPLPRLAATHPTYVDRGRNSPLNEGRLNCAAGTHCLTPTCASCACHCAGMSRSFCLSHSYL